MSYLVDTNICSAHLRNDRRVTSRFMQSTGRLYLATVNLAELNSWILRKNTPEKHRHALREMLNKMALLAIDRSQAMRFGQIQAELLDKGMRASGMDLLIAATALEHDLTLVTHNTQDFESIPGLRLEDWLDS